MEVVLTWHEVLMASEIGRMRKITALRKGSANNHGFAGAGWNEDIEGACAELAVAKALGTYWEGGIDTFKAGDVGGLQVRWTPSHSNSLIVRPQDPDEDRFVLVTGVCPRYVVHGWLTGRDAKDPQWERAYNDRPPAYFVPAGALTPFPSSA